jgi:hypothetical protein
MELKCPVCSGNNLSPETIVCGESTGILGYMYFKIDGKKVSAVIRQSRVCKDCGFVLSFVRDKNGEWEEIKENWDKLETINIPNVK